MTNQPLERPQGRRLEPWRARLAHSVGSGLEAEAWSAFWPCCGGHLLGRPTKQFVSNSRNAGCGVRACPNSKQRPSGFISLRAQLPLPTELSPVILQKQQGSERTPPLKEPLALGSPRACPVLPGSRRALIIALGQLGFHLGFHGLALYYRARGVL